MLKVLFQFNMHHVKNVTNKFLFNNSIKMCTDAINLVCCITGKKRQSVHDRADFLTGTDHFYIKKKHLLG